LPFAFLFREIIYRIPLRSIYDLKDDFHAVMFVLISVSRAACHNPVIASLQPPPILAHLVAIDFKFHGSKTAIPRQITATGNVGTPG
jgi:hypothetical protein